MRETVLVHLHEHAANVVQTSGNVYFPALRRQVPAVGTQAPPDSPIFGRPPDGRQRQHRDEIVGQVSGFPLLIEEQRVGEAECFTPDVHRGAPPVLPGACAAVPDWNIPARRTQRGQSANSGVRIG